MPMANLVRNYSGKSVQKGGTVYVYGAAFSNLTRAWLNNEELKLKDYDYGHAEFTAPTSVGSRTLYVGSSLSDRKSIGTVTVRDYENLQLHRIRIPLLDEIRDVMLGLMPRGFAWYKGTDGVFARLMRGVAGAVRKLYQLAVSFQEESSPTHTTSYSDWERELALPLKGLEQSSAAGRKSEIMRVACKKGGATVPYLKSLLDLYGARYDMYEYWKNSSVFPSWVASKYSDLANFCVLVKVYQDHYFDKGFRCTSKCNATLGEPHDLLLEAILDQAKPGHVKIIYKYVVKVLTDMDGNPIVDDSNRMIIV